MVGVGLFRKALAAAPAVVAACLSLLFGLDPLAAQEPPRDPPSASPTEATPAAPAALQPVQPPSSISDYSPSRSSFRLPINGASETSVPHPQFSVVEMIEPQPAVGPARTRHALSIRSDSTRKAMRSIGLDATSCAWQFRAPSKLNRDGFEIQAQARLSCRY